MKAIVFVVAFVLGTSPIWMNDFEQAKTLARERDKLILLNFSGSDWCGPCIKMKREVFETPEFQSYADENLVLVRADFPRQKKNQLDAKQREHNEKLAERYNPTGKFPLTLLMTVDGKVIQEWNGYSNGSGTEFVGQLRAHAHGK
ncbi:thioredoxin family protein [Parachryseolinea silvisoli]|jgi:thioredoxin-related protein|uniref:thioredoxin family protein n=1 Tax=Parachryseolinea silvisoli TaxID=2873601 RepID=UPI002265DBFF|nr:thioredoxin family protein [Parachryseolinea silvisoli]MCD9015115.1 thioredoxin family protein [Parachryseolinea silvisoli]